MVSGRETSLLLNRKLDQAWELSLGPDFACSDDYEHIAFYLSFYFCKITPLISFVKGSENFCSEV